MLPQEMNMVCKKAFLELVFQTSKYQEKTWCYFNPFRRKNPSYHITIADKATGYASVIPLNPKSAMLLDKNGMKQIYVKILDALLLASKKHQKHAKPVDYKQYPIKAEGHQSKLEHIEKNDKVIVEIYGWSKLIV